MIILYFLIFVSVHKWTAVCPVVDDSGMGMMVSPFGWSACDGKIIRTYPDR